MVSIAGAGRTGSSTVTATGMALPVADALTDVRRVHPDYSADVLNYIVHFYSWPFEDEESRLPPPPANPFAEGRRPRHSDEGLVPANLP